MTTLHIKLQKTTKMIPNTNYDTVRAALRDVLGDHSDLIGSMGKHYYRGYLRESNNGDEILAVHLEKRRGKMVPVMKKDGRSKKEAPVRKWQPSYWIMTVTHIPTDLLKFFPQGSTFVQHKHYWELTTRK